MKTPTTWVLVADGGRARVLSSESRVKPLQQVAHLSFASDAPMTHEIGAARPGRTHESQGAVRHAYEPRSDAHTSLKEAFVRSVLDAVAIEHGKGAFDHLIVVAPPAVLGFIRAAMPQALQAVLAGEIAKDLTKIPNEQIRSHLPDGISV